MNKKILIVTGSPRKATHTTTQEMATTLNIILRKKGYDVTTLDLRYLKYEGCNACGYCLENTGCSIQDDLTSCIKEINKYNAIYLVFPIYNFGISALMQKFIERLNPYGESRLIGAVIIHGSEDDYFSGLDLVYESLARGITYTGNVFFGAVSKTTYDIFKPVTSKDKNKLMSLVDSMESKLNEIKEEKEIKN